MACLGCVCFEEEAQPLPNDGEDPDFDPYSDYIGSFSYEKYMI